MVELIKVSNVKKHINNLGLRASKGALAQLDRKLMLAITTAVKVAKEDNRTTVQSMDVY